MQGLERLRRTRDLRDAKYARELDAKHKDTLREVEDAREKWVRAVDAAPLIMPDEPYKPLREFKPRQVRCDTDYWNEDSEYNINSIQLTLHRFHTAARADLGFEPMVWKPTIVGAPAADIESHETP
jgi:hypothetical protein